MVSSTATATVCALPKQNPSEQGLKHLSGSSSPERKKVLRSQLPKQNPSEQGLKQRNEMMEKKKKVVKKSDIAKKPKKSLLELAKSLPKGKISLLEPHEFLKNHAKK